MMSPIQSLGNLVGRVGTSLDSATFQPVTPSPSFAMVPDTSMPRMGEAPGGGG